MFFSPIITERNDWCGWPWWGQISWDESWYHGNKSGKLWWGSLASMLVCIQLSVCLSVCRAVFLSVCVGLSLSLYLPLQWLSAMMSVCSSIGLSFFLPACLSVYHYILVCRFVILSVAASALCHDICLSVHSFSFFLPCLWFLRIFPDFRIVFKSPFASKCSWKKRSSHQGKKDVTCIVSKPLVSCSCGCGESVNPPK